MSSKFMNRMIGFIMMLLLMVAGWTGSVQTRAYGAEQGPDVLITEVMPMSQGVDDAYEYIELYNNSENSINLKDYKFAYPNIDINESKVVPSKGVVVLCLRSTTTLEKFNLFYNTSLTEDKYFALPLAYDALDNQSECITLATDGGDVITGASYERIDFDTKKSVTYKYPQDGFYMSLLGRRQTPGPGVVTQEQIPYEGVAVTGITLNKTTVNMEVTQIVTLVPTVAPATASNKSVTWSSSASNIAEVNQNGVVTAKSQGTCIITAKTVDGGYMASCAVIVNRIPVTGISLSDTSVSVYTGKAVVLEESITPENATNKSVTWRSNNADVASVDSSGVVTGNTPGTAVISVKAVDGGRCAYCTVTVNKSGTYVSVTGITLDKTTAAIETGKAVSLKATVKPLNATNKKVSWSSNNIKIATVDKNGVVYGKGPGVAVITVRTEDGGYPASCAVTVKSKTDDGIDVRGVRLNTHMMVMDTGETEDLDASILPIDADNKNVTWASDNTSVATVNSSGNVTAIDEGVAIITVKTVEGSYADRCIVIVGDYHFDDSRDIIGIWLNKFMINLFSGHTEKLNARVSSNKLYNKKIVWSTSDSQIATVSDDGKVTGHESGMAVITASTQDGTHKASCYVYVSDQNGNGKDKDKGKGKGKGWGWGHWKW